MPQSNMAVHLRLSSQAATSWVPVVPRCDGAHVPWNGVFGMDGRRWDPYTFWIFLEQSHVIWIDENWGNIIYGIYIINYNYIYMYCIIDVIRYDICDNVMQPDQTVTWPNMHTIWFDNSDMGTLMHENTIWKRPDPGRLCYKPLCK